MTIIAEIRARLEIQKGYRYPNGEYIEDVDHLLATIDKLAYVIAMGRANHQATAQL